MKACLSEAQREIKEIFGKFLQFEAIQEEQEEFKFDVSYGGSSLEAFKRTTGIQNHL